MKSLLNSLQLLHYIKAIQEIQYTWFFEPLKRISDMPYKIPIKYSKNIISQPDSINLPESDKQKNLVHQVIKFHNHEKLLKEILNNLGATYKMVVLNFKLVEYIAKKLNLRGYSITINRYRMTDLREQIIDGKEKQEEERKKKIKERKEKIEEGKEKIEKIKEKMEKNKKERRKTIYYLRVFVFSIILLSLILIFFFSSKMFTVCTFLCVGSIYLYITNKIKKLSEKSLEENFDYEKTLEEIIKESLEYKETLENEKTLEYNESSEEKFRVLFYQEAPEISQYVEFIIKDPASLDEKKIIGIKYKTSFAFIHGHYGRMVGYTKKEYMSDQLIQDIEEILNNIDIPEITYYEEFHEAKSVENKEKPNDDNSIIINNDN
ncbi:TPA: hypothetical protein DEP21_00255 [Patescibacteria group bacterium]|nr:hypothetical protein [Candidatus Gracilibacteria bacterium]